jgi:hypothetical protein
VGKVAETPRITSSVTIHRTPTLASSMNRPYWSHDRPRHRSAADVGTSRKNSPEAES